MLLFSTGEGLQLMQGVFNPDDYRKLEGGL